MSYPEFLDIHKRLHNFWKRPSGLRGCNRGNISILPRMHYSFLHIVSTCQNVRGNLESYIGWVFTDWKVKRSVKVLVAQSCLTLCDPMDCSPPSSSVHGILQAIILEWIAIPFSRASSRSRDPTWVACIAGGFFTAEPPGKPPFFLSR